MIDFIVTKGTKLAKHNAHNTYIVLNNWLIMGLQSGFKRKEMGTG